MSDEKTMSIADMAWYSFRQWLATTPHVETMERTRVVRMVKLDKSYSSDEMAVAVGAAQTFGGHLWRIAYVDPLLYGSPRKARVTFLRNTAP